MNKVILSNLVASTVRQAELAVDAMKEETRAFLDMPDDVTLSWFYDTKNYDNDTGTGHRTRTNTETRSRSTWINTSLNYTPHDQLQHGWCSSHGQSQWDEQIRKMILQLHASKNSKSKGFQKFGERSGGWPSEEDASAFTKLKTASIFSYNFNPCWSSLSGEPARTFSRSSTTFEDSSFL